jgi:hypothetical protein
MNQLATVILFSWGAGLAAFIGGVFANIEGSYETEGKRELIHGIVAFGGGILVAAVAFSLTPEGMETLTPTVLAITFSLGGGRILLYGCLFEPLTRKSRLVLRSCALHLAAFRLADVAK